MNYEKYYKEMIESSGRYTDNEKETIKKILTSLDIGKMPEELKNRYLSNLKSILLSIDILNDKDANSEIIRPGYNRRLEILLDTINYENEKKSVNEDNEEKIEEENKVIKNEINSNDKYTDGEKEIIKKILVLLRTSKLLDDSKKKYVANLKNILLSIDALSDEEANSKVIRPGYKRRLEVLFNSINYELENTPVVNDYKETIEQRILEFNNNCDLMTKEVEKVQDKLSTTTEDVEVLHIKKDFKRIDNKFIELFDNTGKKVKSLIEQIKQYKDEAQASMDIIMIEEKIDSLKKSIRDAKLLYIEKYNKIVEDINKKIIELKKNINVDEKNVNKIDNLKELPIYFPSKSFAFNNKLGSVDTSKLIKNINAVDSYSVDNHETKALVEVKDNKENDKKVIDLENKINELGVNADRLNEQLKKVKKIITVKETRKNVDKIIDKFENEFETCEKYLELYKDKDKARYNELKKKMDELQNKLVDLSVTYRSKCPLLVKKTKSAKGLYRKHKKLPLVASGLASLSLIDFVVGPIIIPAIMCGNMMLVRKNPEFHNPNKVLASVIDAKKYEDGYKLHNGIKINEETASVAVLKAIAVTETKEFIASLVYSARKLFEKMKLVRLKENIVSKMASKKKKEIDSNAKSRKARG